MVSRSELKDYVDENLVVLSQEVLHWQKTGKLPEGALFNKLAALYEKHLGEGDSGANVYQMAESLVARAAMDHVAHLNDEQQHPSGM